MKRAKHHWIWGAIVFAAAAAFPASGLPAECSTVIASTPSGATFPCTVCVEGGRPISVLCTPTTLGR